MSKFKDIEQLSQSDLETFFETSDPITYDFVEAASRSKLPKAFVSRHSYLAAIDSQLLVMWTRHRSISKSLADVACSIELSELQIDDTWTKKSKKGCELLFPDGQRVIIESVSKDNAFIEALTEAIAQAAQSEATSFNDEEEFMEEDVFTEAGVDVSDASFLASTTMGLPESIDSESADEKTTSAFKKESKTPVVTREVIIESLKRASEGAISVLAVKQWAMKVRDYKIIDADEAMVSYILFSLTRLDTDDEESAKNSIDEYYERLTVTLV